MSDEQEAPETRGVTVKLLATVDLRHEIEGMAGRQLRTRMVTIEPGGVFGPIHDHKDRPGMVYILQGTITDVTKGATTAHVRIDLGGGVTVTASITNEAVDELKLKKGEKAYAVIKATDVMVGLD